MGANAFLTCHLCGQEHRSIHLEPGEKALCTRCDAVLAKGRRPGSDIALVFSITGLVLSVPAALLPFIGAGKLGDKRISLLFTGVETLWNNGMRAVAVLVVLCGGLLPLAFLATLVILRAPPGLAGLVADRRFLVRVARQLEHWAIPEVQVLAVLVALFKLGTVVQVTIGPGFWCYCAMALSLLIAQHSFDFDPGAPAPESSTLSRGWLGSGAALPLALAAAVMLVPANLLPVLATETAGRNRVDTIFSGAVELWRRGLGALAIIVFTASILIPVVKLVGLGRLLWGARQGPAGNSRRLTKIYAAIDFIGRWSMLDVFLAAFLAGLVRFGELSTVEPRGGIVAFAAAVVLTVLATQAFDPRVLWSGAGSPDRATLHPRAPGRSGFAPAPP